MFLVNKKKLKELIKVSQNIPNYLKKKDGRVDLSKFKKKKKNSNRKEGPKGWWISKDTAKHCDSAWKLMNKAGNRIATLWSDGSIRGK